MSQRTYTVDELEAFYHLFGLKPGAQFSDVKKEFRFLAQAFHTDKYEEGSSLYKRAKAKFIELTDAKEALEEFLENNPSGEPEGGWPSQNRPKQQTQSINPSSHQMKDGYVKWEDWKGAEAGGNKTQSEATRQVIEQWQKDQEEKQEHLGASFSQEERAKFAFYGRILLVITALLLQYGHHTANESMIQNHPRSFLDMPEYKKLKRDYKRYKIDQTTYETEAPILKKKWQDETNKKNLVIISTGFFTLVFMLFTGWVLVFPQPREFVKSWVEGESKNG